MFFGKIDYLNLLPFHVFLRRSPLQSYVKKGIEHKKGVPSRLNNALRAGRVDAAVISSVQSRRKAYRTLDMGIVARQEVKSVLVRKNSQPRQDSASASSNALAQILGIRGEVVIGDRALLAYLKEGEENFDDLAQIWHERTGLPFVFARFCYRKNGQIYSRLTHAFLRRPVKLPGYVLRRYAATRGILPEQIRWYLKFISYEIKAKEKKSLSLFFRRHQALKFKNLLTRK